MQNYWEKRRAVKEKYLALKDKKNAHTFFSDSELTFLTHDEIINLFTIRVFKQPLVDLIDPGGDSFLRRIVAESAKRSIPITRVMHERYFQLLKKLK